MRKIVALIVLLISGFTLSAQTNCDCKSELDFVFEQMQGTYSFKSQMKGQAIENFKTEYQNLRSSLPEEMPMVACFWKLNELMGLVRDKHALLYSAQPDFGYKEAKDSAFVAEYRKTETFLNHPKTDLNLEVLRASLATKPYAGIEGIYNISNAMKLGIYLSEETGEYIGVNLESRLGVWEPGEVMLYLRETSRPNEYDIVSYGQVQKNLNFYKSQVYQFGYLFSNVSKEGTTNNHFRIDRDQTRAYELTQLNDEVQYMWLDGFGRYEKEEQRDALIEQINKGLTASNPIVDLRDNGGGASKISMPILRALKKKSDTKVYVLTNFYSGSNAEQTTVRLKKIKGTVHLGQRTNGTIAYGRNYNHAYESPSGLFTFRPTDMKFNHFLKYEEVGVTPDIALDNESDWIEQTMNIINSQNQ